MKFMEYILAESFGLKDAESKMSSSMDAFICHIMKIQYAKNRSQNHWERELIALMKKFITWSKVKTKGKTISYKRLREGVLIYCEPNLIKNFKFSIKHYNPIDFDYREFSEWVTDFFDVFFKDLTTNSIDIEEQLNKILKNISSEVRNIKDQKK